MRQKPLVFIIAGEASGDLLGGQLMVGLKTLYHNNVDFVGVGGDTMIQQGMESLFPLSDLSLIGFIDIIKHLPRVIQRLRQTVKAIQELKPDVVITIDAQDFSWRVAKVIRKKRQGTKPRLIHYVAPTVWAWRPKRAKKLAKIYDHLLTLYPFENSFFEKEGLPTTFVGHPVVQVRRGDKKYFYKSASWTEDSPVLCLLPGSRRSEILTLLPIFKKTVDLLKKDVPTLKIIIPTLKAVEEIVREQTQSWDLAPLIVVGEKEREDAFAASTVALAASGTVAMQLAVAQVPTVIAYKVGKISEFIMRFLLKTPWVCMINILLQKEVIPECLQNDCHPKHLATELLTLLTNQKAQEQQKHNMMSAIDMLASPDKETPHLAAAKAVIKFI